MPKTSLITTEKATARAVKILARALDPACRDGEAETSATMFARCCRRDGISLAHLVSALAPIDRDDPPAACQIVMSFGRYAGSTLEEIARVEPSYLTWAVENMRTKPELQRACRAVAEWYGVLTPEEVAP